jgi:hypothetical protein
LRVRLKGGSNCAPRIGGRLDVEQLGGAHSIVAGTATRHLPVYAAILAVTTACTESTLHDATT